MATLRPLRISSSTSRDSSATLALWALTSGLVPLRSWKRVCASSMITITSGQDEDGPMPGVGDAEDLGDGALAVEHQPVDASEHVADLVEVVLGRRPGPRHEPVVVGAALAVDEHVLHGGGGGELAEQMGDQHGLADPASPATTMPETSASRTMTRFPSSAQPSHHESKETGAVPGRSIGAGASSGS
jgi:hypothetical protein